MKLQLLTYPDPRLRQVAKPVETVTDEIRAIGQAMIEKMYEENGVGLASIQVNILHRLFVADCSESRTEAKIYINPEITEALEKYTAEEGCLSCPGAYAKVERAKVVTLRYIDEKGQPQEIVHADGLLAKCFQHEIDHLNGKLFIDRVSPLKQGVLKRKIEKFIKENIRAL